MFSRSSIKTLQKMEKLRQNEIVHIKMCIRDRLAFFGLLLPSVASLLAQSFSGYKLVMALAEATMAAACAYFLARGLKAFSLGQGLFTLTRADFILSLIHI